MLTVAQYRAPRHLDEFSTEVKLEDGELTLLQLPSVRMAGLTTVVTATYYFSSVHTRILQATEKCAEAGATLADVLDEAENDFIKGVLMAINPQGRDRLLAGRHGLQQGRHNGLADWETLESFFLPLVLAWF